MINTRWEQTAKNPSEFLYSHSPGVVMTTECEKIILYKRKFVKKNKNADNHFHSFFSGAVFWFGLQPNQPGNRRINPDFPKLCLKCMENEKIILFTHLSSHKYSALKILIKRTNLG